MIFSFDHWRPNVKANLILLFKRRQGELEDDFSTTRPPTVVHYTRVLWHHVRVIVGVDRDDARRVGTNGLGSTEWLERKIETLRQLGHIVVDRLKEDCLAQSALTESYGASRLRRSRKSEKCISERRRAMRRQALLVVDDLKKCVHCVACVANVQTERVCMIRLNECDINCVRALCQLTEMNWVAGLTPVAPTLSVHAHSDRPRPPLDRTMLTRITPASSAALTLVRSNCTVPHGLSFSTMRPLNCDADELMTASPWSTCLDGDDGEDTEKQEE